MRLSADGMQVQAWLKWALTKSKAPASTWKKLREIQSRYFFLFLGVAGWGGVSNASRKLSTVWGRNLVKVK